MEHLNTTTDLLLIEENLDTEEIETKVSSTRPKALIPPYDLMDEIYTARCAEWAKNTFPNHKVGIVIPAVLRARAIQLIRLFQRTGYTPIIFHQDFPLIPWIPSLKKHLEDDQWYHACGMDINLFTGVPGHWTRGDIL